MENNTTIKSQDAASRVEALVLQNIVEADEPENFIRSLDVMFDHWLIHHELEYSAEQRAAFVGHYRGLRETIQELSNIFSD